MELSDGITGNSLCDVLRCALLRVSVSVWSVFYRGLADGLFCHAGGNPYPERRVYPCSGKKRNEPEQCDDSGKEPRV
mgnify:CR=1 FL=1